LIGGQAVIANNDTEKMLTFYGELFQTLLEDVLALKLLPPKALTRYVTYRAPVGEGETLHFLGIEVEAITALPTDRMGWELDAATWRVWEAQGGRAVLAAQQALTWQWRTAGPLGEFRASLPASWRASSAPPTCRFRLSGNAPLTADLTNAAQKTERDAVHLVDYDPGWTKQFDDLAQWLRETFGPRIIRRVEHYGSTAIPDMPAKPIIDALVEIPSFDEAKQTVIPRLNKPQWAYWWHADHMVFVKRRGIRGPRTHHVHMAPRDHPLWDGLRFRDHLRAHPAAAARYATLKRTLAEQYREDRERYTQAKTAFVHAVLKEAKACNSGK
jgi:GrpB-like predicted nucleotidyltransferase (UPF0157 family)/predicted transcriptional regulator YdeE